MKLECRPYAHRGNTQVRSMLSHPDFLLWRAEADKHHIRPGLVNLSHHLSVFFTAEASEWWRDAARKHDAGELHSNPTR